MWFEVIVLKKLISSQTNYAIPYVCNKYLQPNAHRKNLNPTSNASSNHAPQWQTKYVALRAEINHNFKILEFRYKCIGLEQSHAKTSHSGVDYLEQWSLRIFLLPIPSYIKITSTTNGQAPFINKCFIIIIIIMMMRKA